MSRIIVKNLPDKITKERLLQIFSEKGKVTDVQLKFTKDGKFRKFGFIGFQKPEQAEAAKNSLNKSFINTSQIQIEICAELGDPNKPRPWSKYAPENIAKKRKKEESINDNNNETPKSKKLGKEKIKDQKVIELLKNHENDQLFTEFMEANASELPGSLQVNKKEEKSTGKKKPKKQGEEDEEEGSEEDGSEEEEEEEEEDLEEKKNILANQDISDAEYFKLKTGKEISIKEESTKEKEKEKIGKKAKSLELFTIKMCGLPFKVKKKQIKEFLSPVKPFTIRKALKMNGVAYCGFKTEKEMKISLFKNRSFLDGRRIYVSAVKKKTSLLDEETEKRWKKENERLKGLETVAESGRIFVRNLPYTVTEDDLKPSFEKFGPVTEFILPIDSFTRKPKGFAVITFLIPEHACRAYNELDGTIFQGRMLHLLPALPNKTDAEEEDNFGESYKTKKLKKEKAKSNSSVNWNTFFIGENALADAMAATYKTSKENVLDDTKGGAAVRLALGETQLINKMREFLEENDVSLEAFENMSVCSRSKTVILVKNLPFGTNVDEIRAKFSKFGELKRIVLPPSGVAALVEFIEPSEAKIAFRRVAYSKFKHVPMYLEWAPEKVFKKDIAQSDKKDGDGENEKAKEEKKEPEVAPVASEETETQLDLTPEEGAILFVKNLNFATEDEALRKHFSTCGTVLSAKVAKKRDPFQPGKTLSMGYGFVEYALKEHADKALKTLQFSNLDEHKIELKRSNRTVAPEINNRRKTTKSNEKPSTKILVRNVPFQATQREIADLFKVFGEIKAVRLPKKMVGTGSHRGFCFVEFNTIHDAKRAFKALSQSTHLYGRRLVLEWASSDDDVATLREKTAYQFKSGGSGVNEKKKNITIEEGEGEGSGEE